MKAFAQFLFVFRHEKLIIKVLIHHICYIINCKLKKKEVKYESRNKTP